TPSIVQLGCCSNAHRAHSSGSTQSVGSRVAWAVFGFVGGGLAGAAGGPSSLWYPESVRGNPESGISPACSGSGRALLCSCTVLAWCSSGAGIELADSLTCGFWCLVKFTT